MTLPTTTSAVTYAGNGVTTQFDWTFLIPSGALEIYRTENDIAVLVEASAYSASGLDDPNGGTVTFAAAPASGQTITIKRNVALTQDVALVTGSAFYAEVIEDAFDKAAMQIQQLAEEMGRAVQVPIGSGLDPADYMTTVSGYASAAAVSESIATAKAAAAQTAAASLRTLKSQGAVGDGVTDDAGVLSAATGTVRITDGVYRIGSSVTISANLVFEGGVLQPAAGATVTLAGVVSADAYARIFDGSSGGTVFPQKTRVWSFCWFGAFADGTNGAANAVAKAHYDRAYALISGVDYYTTQVPSGRFENSGPKDYTDMFVLWKPQTALVGGGAASTWMKFGVQIMSDDCDVRGITAWGVRYGLILDDESDTAFPQYFGPTADEYTMPRYGEAVRASSGIAAPNGRRLRSDITDFQAFACAYGCLNLDNSPDTYLSNCRFAASTVDGWVEYKSYSSGDDVGNTHWTNVIVEQSGRHNLLVLKAGTFLTANCKIFNTAVGAKQSVFVLAKNQSAPHATGYEVIRQFWLNNASLEGTTTRSIPITGVADAGGGAIDLTLASEHYIGAGNFRGVISGTASYNGSSVRVIAVPSDTSLTVVPASGSFTFGASETGTLTLPQIDLWIEGEEDGPKRIIRTQIVGGDCNAFVLKNARNVVIKAGITGKESGYIRKCKAVVADVGLGFNKVTSSDARYSEGFTPWNIDTDSEVYRSGWYDEYAESYYVRHNGKARVYDFSNGPLERVGVGQRPSLVTFSNYAHGVAELGSFASYGRNSAGAKVAYGTMRFYAQGVTAGAEDSVVVLAYPRSGANVTWSWRRGLYYGTLSDPATPGTINSMGLQVNNANVVDADGGVRFPALAATAIAAIGNAINATNKAPGKTVWDSTNHRLMVASGSSASDPWYVADGSASVTPA